MPARIVRHNPVELHKPPGYHHITVVESGRLAFLAGQCPIDASGALVGGDNIDRQIDQVAATPLSRSLLSARRQTTSFGP